MDLQISTTIPVQDSDDLAFTLPGMTLCKIVSKLPTEDIEHVATLGFRGEALPSIASVAQLTLESRVRGQEGWALTIDNGTRVAEAGTLTRDILSRLLDDLIIVREAELRETLARLMLEEHIVAEGAGALALAAGRRVASRRKVAVVSGGNIDAAVFAQLLLDTRPRPPRPPRRRAADWPVPPPQLAEGELQRIQATIDGEFSRVEAEEWK
jgi:hypothetical protein